MDLSQRTADRVNARNKASMVFSLCQDEADEIDGEDAQQAYWEALRTAVLEFAPLPKPIVPRKAEPMTAAQAREFEKLPMPWGKHEGTPIGEVDRAYLEWAAEPDQFKADLNRYLLADRSAPDLDEAEIPY